MMHKILHRRQYKLSLSAVFIFRSNLDLLELSVFRLKWKLAYGWFTCETKREMSSAPRRREEFKATTINEVDQAANKRIREFHSRAKATSTARDWGASMSNRLLSDHIFRCLCMSFGCCYTFFSAHKVSVVAWMKYARDQSSSRSDFCLDPVQETRTAEQHISRFLKINNQVDHLQEEEKNSGISTIEAKRIVIVFFGAERRANSTH